MEDGSDAITVYFIELAEHTLLMCSHGLAKVCDVYIGWKNSSTSTCTL